jgi:two-component system sensor histidine kinase/response regulator
MGHRDATPPGMPYLEAGASDDGGGHQRVDGLASQLAAVVDLSADAIIGKTLDGTIVSWNPGAEKLYGYAVAEVQGKPISMLVPAGRADEVATLIARVAAGGVVNDFQTVRRCRDGSLVDVSLNMSAVRGPTGRVVEVSAIARDITAHKRAERELAQARQDIDQFFSTSLDVMAILDADGKFVRVNPAFGQTLGLGLDEIVGHSLVDFIHPDDRQAALDQHSERLGGTGQLSGVENRLRCADGSYRWLLWSATSAESGLIYATARDVTEARVIEAELRSSQAQALEASRLKSEFVANMSHEIRTPLNGVVCMAELMLDTSLSDEQREYANVGLTSAEALMRVINDILDFSKIEAGKLDIVDEDFSVEAAANDVCEILGMNADEKGIELAVVVDPEVPSVVRGDGSRVRQMLINLVSNAIKFTPDGTIEVRIDVASAGDESALLRVEVADTGIGIDPERLAELFEPFAQAGGKATRRYEGTGLGLSITKQLAELMGGEIGVESKPGTGSSFWFTLPCVPGSAPETGVAVRDLTGTRVLVVDDDDSIRRMLGRQLASWGMIPDSAGDGRSALALMHRAADAGRPHEAAVIDMRMPEMDGLELARAIKATPRLRGARLILLSGAHVPVRDAQAAGIDAVLTKPARPSLLCDQLVNSLSRTSRHSQRESRPSPTVTGQVTQALASMADGGRVLVAEDNEINQIAARRVLQKLGFSVDIARDGREAIEQSGRADYSAVFMDCQMPEMDGYDATAVIRRREGNRRHTPIIAITASTMQGDRDRCLAAGMDDYITKPLRFANVQSVLARFFSEDDTAGDSESHGSGGAGGDGEPMGGEPTGGEAAGGEAAGSEATGSDALPLIDRAIVTEILSDGGDQEGLVDLFVTLTSSRLQDLANAVKQGDADEVALITHSLTGSCATFGAVRLASATARLADVDAPAPAREAETLHTELKGILAATEAAIAEVAAAMAAPTAAARAA